MKIGKFAEKNNLSIDTIRHYMDLGLIITEKDGGQYSFGEECQKDIEDIKLFKQMGLKLNEIKKVLMFKRLGNLSNYQKNEYYKSIFLDKHKQVENQIDELKKTKKNLEKEIEQLSEINHSDRCLLGLDFKNLKLINCIDCGKNMTLFSNRIENNKVINGRLSCSCGREYLIEDGIIIVKKDECNGNKIADISKYITSTDDAYVENVYRSLEWNKKRLQNDMQNKIMLELGSGYGFFLRLIYNDLPDDSTYIAVDSNLRLHKFLKNILEQTGVFKDIIFICADFLDIPLLDKTVDIILDGSGTTNFSFTNEDFLLNKINYIFKDKCSLYGAFILFEKFKSDNNIDVKFRKNFKLEYVKKKLEQLGYIKIDENISKVIDKGGKYEDFFLEGEKVFHYNYYGQR